MHEAFSTGCFSGPGTWRRQFAIRRGDVELYQDVVLKLRWQFVSWRAVGSCR